MILYMPFEVSSGYDHRCKDTDSQTRKHPWIPFQFSAFEYSPPLRVEARAVPYAWQGHLKAGSSGAQKGGSKVKIPLDLLHVNGSMHKDSRCVRSNSVSRPSANLRPNPTMH